MGDLIGYFGVLLAIFFFGSNFIVTKKYETGDGFFFQIPFCLGIWTTGLVVNLIRFEYTGETNRFYPTAMLAGLIWESGNILCIPIIARIGMGLGLIIWGTSALLIGWFTGYFGLFGLSSEKDQIDPLWLNLLGLGFATLSLLAAFKVKKTDVLHEDSAPAKGSTEDTTAVATNADCDPLASPLVGSEENATDTSLQINPRRHWEGIAMAMLAGLFFGSNFDPCTWVQEHDAKASQSSLDYVFSHFCGILLTALAYFLGYCVFKHNHPVINPRLALPAFVSGVCWAIAQIGWFIANGTCKDSAFL